MKKRTVSLLLALVLMLSLAPAAFAAREENCYLGSVRAGQDFRVYVTDIDSNAEIGSTVLPDGCRIELENRGDATKVYLAGRISSPGYELFTLPVMGDEQYIVNCSIEVTEDAPTVTTSADISCKLGDTAYISVQVSGGTNLRYQWYSVSTGRIDGATSNTYRPNTMLVGTHEYYCEVTSGSASEIGTTVRSANISVTVYGVAVAEEIGITFLPDKLEYNLGEAVDTTGLILSVRYSDGTSKMISGGFGVFPTSLTQTGRQSIQISYENCTCSYEVTVGIGGLIESLGVLERPDKTIYKIGDSFDATGLVIRVYYKGSGYKDVEADELEYSPKTFTEAGAQVVTVTYEGKTCSFSVSVEDDKKEISVASLPSKLEYTVGDKLDTTGLSINVASGGRTQTITNGFSCTPKVLTTAGTQEITVIYEGINKCTFKVTVNEKETSPSPSPSATPTPIPTPSASAAPTQTPVPTPVRHESHETNFAGTLMKVVLVIAMFCLVGIGAYFVVLKKNGKKRASVRRSEPVSRPAPADRPKQVTPEKEAPAAPTAGAVHPDRANSHIDDDPIDADKFAEDWDEIKK